MGCGINSPHLMPELMAEPIRAQAGPSGDGEGLEK